MVEHSGLRGRTFHASKVCALGYCLAEQQLGSEILEPYISSSQSSANVKKIGYDGEYRSNARHDHSQC